jgi:hypothetical protein
MKRLLIALVTMITLSGCNPLQELGKGLGSLFRNINIPLP